MSARGVTCPATRIIIGKRTLEVKVTRGVCLSSNSPSAPYQSQGTLWTRRDSNPHLVAGQANVRPLHHGPQRSLCDPAQREQGRPSHPPHKISQIGDQIPCRLPDETGLARPLPSPPRLPILSVFFAEGWEARKQTLNHHLVAIPQKSPPPPSALTPRPPT